MASLYSQGSDGPIYVSSELDKPGLSEDQQEKGLSLIKLAVSDATHSIVCDIDGVSSLVKSLQTKVASPFGLSASANYRGVNGN